MKLVAIAAVCACACAKQAPQGLPPAQDWNAQGSNSTGRDQPQGHRVPLGPYSIVVPASWTPVATKSEMRAGQFTVGSDAELVIYYFGPDGAGTNQDNIERWVGQFSRDDGKPLAPEIEETSLLGYPAVLVRVTGHYQAMAMPGTAPVDKADQALLAAITGSASGPYYWKLVGSAATVAAERRAFDDMLKTMKLK